MGDRKGIIPSYSAAAYRRKESIRLCRIRMDSSSVNFPPVPGRKMCIFPFPANIFSHKHRLCRLRTALPQAVKIIQTLQRSLVCRPADGDVSGPVHPPAYRRKEFSLCLLQQDLSRGVHPQESCISLPVHPDDPENGGAVIFHLLSYYQRQGWFGRDGAPYRASCS